MRPRKGSARIVCAHVGLSLRQILPCSMVAQVALKQKRNSLHLVDKEGDQMRQVRSAAHHLRQILTEIVNARLPTSVWLDSTTLHLYKTRP